MRNDTVSVLVFLILTAALDGILTEDRIENILKFKGLKCKIMNLRGGFCILAKK